MRHFAASKQLFNIPSKSNSKLTDLRLFHTINLTVGGSSEIYVGKISLHNSYTRVVKSNDSLPHWHAFGYTVQVSITLAWLAWSCVPEV